MRGKSWLVLALFALGCAKAERAEAPAASSQAAPAPEPARPGAKPAEPETVAPSPAPTSTLEEEPKTKDRDALRPITTLAEAETALKQAESDLDALVGRKGRAGTTAATPLAAGDPRCGNACKAFESLRRAADAVCRLAGDGDARCTRARNIVKENEGRVAACKCEPAKD